MRRQRGICVASCGEVHGQQRVAQSRRDPGRRAERRLPDERLLPERVRGEHAQHVRRVLGKPRAEQRTLEHLGAVRLGLVVVGHEARIVHRRVRRFGQGDYRAIRNDDVVFEPACVGRHPGGLYAERGTVRRDGLLDHRYFGAVQHEGRLAARGHACVRVAKGGRSLRRLDDPRCAEGASAAEVESVYGHGVGRRVDFHEFALIRVPAGVRVAACAAGFVVPVVFHPEVIGERGGLDEREPVVLINGARVRHRDVGVAGEVDDLRILLAQLLVERAGLRRVGILVELAVPAVRTRVPYGVRERVMREQEYGLGRILRRRGRAAFEDPIALRSVPAVVVAARFGRDRQHVVASYGEVGIHLAFVRTAWHLERTGHVQLRGEERLERVLGVLLAAAPVVVLVVAHDDADRLARASVQQLRELDVLVRVAGVGRVAHEEMRVHVGCHGVDGRERFRDLVAVVVVRACADMGVAVHGEADLVAGQRRPVRGCGLRERGCGLLLRKDEHPCGG